MTQRDSLDDRILVVDDDHKLVRLLRASVEQAGYQVIVAYNGETALHALRRERADLVVLDLVLPDRDGWDVTRVIRNDAALAHTPIIMLTARVEPHDRAAAPLATVLDLCPSSARTTRHETGVLNLLPWLAAPDRSRAEERKKPDLPRSSFQRTGGCPASVAPPTLSITVDTA